MNPNALRSEVVNRWSDLSAHDRNCLVDLYARVFAEAPYYEDFSGATANDIISRIFALSGLMTLTRLASGRIVAFSGGYPKDDSIFFIEELGVDPRFQGQGIGRATLRALIDATSDFVGWELRTERDNVRALGLYRSFGFAPRGATEVVARSRTSGSVGLDIRVHLAKGVPGTDAFHRLAVAYPSGNTTALLFDQLQESDRRELNQKVVDLAQATLGIPDIEQCGFICLPTRPESVARLEMFGGEFCGNALRSAAWLVMGGQDAAGFIECSGVKSPLGFDIRGGRVRLEMPLPVSAETAGTPIANAFEVRLEGITHIVEFGPFDSLEEPRVTLTRLLRKGNPRYASLPAFGVTQFDDATEQARFAVWVGAVETTYDETACGSGSAAIAIALALRDKSSIIADVIQPSGAIITSTAELDARGTISRAAIEGTVEVLFDGRVWR